MARRRQFPATNNDLHLCRVVGSAKAIANQSRRHHNMTRYSLICFKQRSVYKIDYYTFVQQVTLYSGSSVVSIARELLL